MQALAHVPRTPVRHAVIRTVSYTRLSAKIDTASRSLSRGRLLSHEQSFPHATRLPATQHLFRLIAVGTKRNSTSKARSTQSPAGSPSSGPPVAAEIWGVQIPSYWHRRTGASPLARTARDVPNQRALQTGQSIPASAPSLWLEALLNYSRGLAQTDGLHACLDHSSNVAVHFFAQTTALRRKFTPSLTAASTSSSGPDKCWPLPKGQDRGSRR